MARLSDTNSCILTGKFDFSVRETAGKWASPQEIFKLNALRMDNAGGVESRYGYSVVETKSKVRGSGKALVLRFESTDGKDFEILGWAIPVEATTKE